MVDGALSSILGDYNTWSDGCRLRNEYFDGAESKFEFIGWTFHANFACSFS